MKKESDASIEWKEGGFKPLLLTSQKPLVPGAQYVFPKGVRQALEEHFSGSISPIVVCEEGFGDPTDGVLTLEGPGNSYVEWGFTSGTSMKARFRCTGLTSPSRRSAVIRAFRISKEELQEIEAKVRQQQSYEDENKSTTKKSKKQKKSDRLFNLILANLPTRKGE